MRNLSPDFCRQIGQARRDRGISQSALAAGLGCKQPALSAFEAGDGTKLSEETVMRLSEKFGIPIAPPPLDVEGDRSMRSAGEIVDENAPLGFCPNFLCPSNVPYVVAGRLFSRPSRSISAPVSSALRCAACGEVLEHRCPICGAPVNDGACCCFCGQPYVTPVLPPSVDPVAWAAARRAEITSLRALV